MYRRGESSVSARHDLVVVCCDRRHPSPPFSVGAGATLARIRGGKEEMVLAFGAIATPAEEGLLLRPWREVTNNNDPHPIPELMRAIAHMIAEVRTIELPSH